MPITIQPTTLKYKDDNGVFQAVDCLKGEKGDTGNTGQKGDDGFSPVANVSKSGTTATITITDANGTTIAEVSDGDPTTLIDDSSTSSLAKTWSVNKLKNTYLEKSNPVYSGTLSNGRKINTTAGTQSIAIGSSAEASGRQSIAIGYNVSATSDYSIAQGQHSSASGGSSVAIQGSTASGNYAFSSGQSSVASGNYSTAGNRNTQATGDYSTALGFYNTANGTSSCAVGERTVANGKKSIASGEYTIADGDCSFAFGSFNYQNLELGYDEYNPNKTYLKGTKVKITTQENNETVVKYYVCNSLIEITGTFNPANWDEVTGKMKYIEMVGNSLLGDRSNARSLDWDGNEYLAGTLKLYCNPDGTGGKQVAILDNIPSIATVAETLEIINEYESGGDDEEMLFLANYVYDESSGELPGFVTEDDASDIINAFKTGKHVVVRLIYAENPFGITNDIYMAMTGYEPASEFDGNIRNECARFNSSGLDIGNYPTSSCASMLTAGTITNDGKMKFDIYID